LNRALAQAVVGTLRFSADSSHHLSELRTFSQRDWDGTFTWLDHTGVTLYFLQRLKDLKATDAIPAPVLLRFEQNLEANQSRVASMLRAFCALNRKFDDAGVKYAVVKGFSLVPQFCPDAGLRHQADLDYLIDERSLSAAQQMLAERGYFEEVGLCKQFMFYAPSGQSLTFESGQYHQQAPYAIELHLDMWDSDLSGIPLPWIQFSAEKAQLRNWHGFSFPALPDEDVFLLQVLHAFQHVLDGWIRMSWFYEIGYFLNQRAADTEFWQRVGHRVEQAPLMREFVVAVAEIVAKFFGAPIPRTVQAWSHELRPAARIWIRNYAPQWAYGNNEVKPLSLFSTSKLPLLLHRQYIVPDPNVRRQVTRHRLLPSNRLNQIAGSLKKKPSVILEGRWRRRQELFCRVMFHVTSDLRYFWEIPRWRRLNKKAVRLVPA
jgi:hypothetical protein